MKNTVALILIAWALTAGLPGCKSSSPEGALNFTMRTIDGEEQSLTRYRGKAVLIVNVASRCGLTPQYEALQKVYETYHAQGLEILGFPANNFKAQEPGSDSDIKAFCTATYGVTFPLFSKISVAGEDIHPLYRFLTDEKTNPEFGGAIQWNFTKFLISRKGQIVARFEPKVKPDSEEMIRAVENALR
ncbi:glutathione peroxidase [bacterium]|nr:glutathione peroxidase [bacterium]